MLSKRKVYCAILVAVVATGLWLLPLRVETVPGLNRSDVIQVRRAVRKEVWRGFYPISSIFSQKEVPSRVWAACRAKVQVTRREPDGTVHADVTYPGHRATLYTLEKQSNHWSIRGRPLTIGW